VIFFQLPGVALGTRKANEAAGIHHISWWRGYRMAARGKRTATQSMIEIAIFPRSKMTITIKDGGRHPPYQTKKT
jgi:hypothetical protein